MKEYIQIFEITARSSGYGKRPLIEKFKGEIDGRIRRQLIEVEYSSKSLKKQYKKVARLDRNYGESRRKEETVRRKEKEEDRERVEEN